VRCATTAGVNCFSSFPARELDAALAILGSPGKNLDFLGDFLILLAIFVKDILGVIGKTA
jgi:hypothetical protein